MSEPPATGVWHPPAGVGPTDGWAVPGYELLGELGRGGMGVVYKARQVSSGRLVALKVIRDGALAGPHEVARFRIEADAASRMRHPNVVEIYDVGEHAGRPFFAMEFIEGGGLDKHLAGRPLPARAAAELVHTLALAVAHAHDRKIVHRDLKPANVLLASGTREGAEIPAAFSAPSRVPLAGLTPKIADFGLAKRLDTDSTALTQDGAVIGTPSYMAPEQAAGRVRDVGPWTDVYALGATLYEVLTGRVPFEAESWDRALQQVIHDDPPPPSRVQPDVPAELEAVCLKCLEKDPASRYADAGELAADLGRFLAGEPVAAVPLGSAERLARAAARDGIRIVGEVGRGPRGIVYHARSDPLNQPVAVKVFPPGTCTRDGWDARVRRAADLWAVLAHPGVVPVRRAGWWDESAYLVLEYVPNGSLAARLAGRPHPVREAVRLVEQLADLVCYLHRQGVVHGNLKPGNVLLAADDIPRVTDFHPTGGLFQGPLPTGEQDPVGVGYLAPEIIRDPAAAPRQHTDVYGLGLILYELLTGRPAFVGATGREVADEVLFRDPAPPSAVNQEVTPDLEAVCLRCLRKNPWRRFPRVYDLVSRLRRFLGERPA